MRVLVVGAGISGIRTAQLLERAGVEVEVYEARNRLGGRLETIDLDEGFYEAGGEWIDSDQPRVISLLKEFEAEGAGLESHSQWPGRVIYQGEEAKEDSVWADAESDSAYVHGEAAALCQKLTETPWLQEELRTLDAQNLGDWLDAQCTSKRGRWWVEAVTRSDEGEDTSRVGLLGWLVGYKHYLERTSGEMSAYRFRGGAQRLVEKMADTLNGKVYLNHILKSVETNEDSAQLWFEGEMAFGDRAVITLPPPTLRQVEFPWDFPDDHLKAWETIGSARAIKVTLRFKRKFWLDQDGWGGRMLSNLPFQQIWDSGRDGAICLSAYICGSEGEKMAKSSQPVESVLRAISEVAPEATDEFLDGQLHDWIHDRFAQGAFTCLSPGSVQASLPWVAEPFGRIHFAGEYTSRWTGFIEGALESAERVAQEILAHAE